MQLAYQSALAMHLCRGGCRRPVKPASRARPTCLDEGEIVLLKVPKTVPSSSSQTTSRALQDFFKTSEYALGIVRELKDKDASVDKDGAEEQRSGLPANFVQLNAQVEFLSVDNEKNVWLESGWTFTGTVEAMEVDWTYGERLIEDRIRNPHGEHAEGFYEILEKLPFDCGSPILRE